MSKIIVKKVTIFFTGLVTLYVFLQVTSYGYWWIRAWGGPDQYAELMDRVRKLPTDAVVKKLHSFQMGNPYPSMALKILVERKDKKAVPVLIKQLYSSNKSVRNDAIWALGVINDTRAVPYLMDIVRHGAKGTNYINALTALSKMHIEDAFPYVVELAKQDTAKSNGSIVMLREFGKAEGIPLLEAIKLKIKDTDPLASFDKSQIDKAIEHIENLHKHIKI